MKPIVSQGRTPFAEFVKHLLQQGISSTSTTFHFFEQDFTYLSVGHQALYLADEFYKTRHSVRNLQGVESLSISKKFFKKICATLMVEHDVALWAKLSTEVNAPFERIAIGGPGHTRDVEVTIGGFGENLVPSDYVAVVNVDSKDWTQLVVAYFNDVDYQITVTEIQDDSTYSK